MWLSDNENRVYGASSYTHVGPLAPSLNHPLRDLDLMHLAKYQRSHLEYLSEPPVSDCEPTGRRWSSEARAVQNVIRGESPAKISNLENSRWAYDCGINIVPTIHHIRYQYGLSNDLNRTNWLSYLALALCSVASYTPAPY